MPKLIVLIAWCMLLIMCSRVEKNNKVGEDDGTMVWIPPGEFLMGSRDSRAYASEKPAHSVTVSGFWLSKAEVTNREFSRFVEATGYVTVAERPLEWTEIAKQLPEATPKPPDSLLVAGSLVFVPPDGPVNLRDITQWWRWVPGASWRHPEGPGSTIKGREDHPVVHVAFEDALAYANWMGMRLPTEAEWERASQTDNDKDPWEMKTDEAYSGNFFQGLFPYQNSGEDRFVGTSPVKSFPANELGLYDMLGNVWEWTSDWYDTRYYSSLDKSEEFINPKGALSYFDPAEPYTPKRVTKGGSFLCSIEYCANYRRTSRQGTAVDSGASNIGFRCAKDLDE